MPHFSSNILSTIYYGSIFPKLFRITSFTLKNNDFLPTASDFFSVMIAKGENGASLAKKL